MSSGLMEEESTITLQKERILSGNCSYSARKPKPSITGMLRSRKITWGNTAVLDALSRRNWRAPSAEFLTTTCCEKELVVIIRSLMKLSMSLSSIRRTRWNLKGLSVCFIDLWRPKVVVMSGIEPLTQGFSVLCSTD